MNLRLFAPLIFALTASLNVHASDAIDEYIRSVLSKQQVPGAAVAVIRDGRVVKEYLYGTASLQLGSPIERETVFQLASVTKIFTVVTLMKLEQEGKLSLDDGVAKYVPELPGSWRTVTLRQLATHTSGLPDLIASPDHPLTETELNRSENDALKYAESLPVVSSPGSQFKYDQTNYLLLKLVVEKVCGLRFRECVKAKVLEPAGMGNTSWGDARSIVPNRSEMYSALHGDPIENGGGLYLYPTYLDAAAGLNSSIADMERLAMALTSGSLLPAAELQQMWATAKRPDGKILDISKEMEIDGIVAPASGWFFADNSGGVAPRVFMAGGSAVSVLALPKQNICVVVLTNLQAKDDPLPVAEGLVKTYLPEFKPML